MNEIGDLQTCRVTLTGGNIRNHHFYLRGCEGIIPTGGIGGKNSAAKGAEFTVMFEPGPTVETDVDGSKMIFRSRSGVRDFFDRSGATEGDRIKIERISDRVLRISLQSTVQF